MSQKIIIIAIVIFSVAVMGGSYFLFAGGGQAEPDIVTYAANSKEKPVAEVKKTLVDLGKMKVDDQKSADFIVKNIGNKPLQLYEMSSSCNCTFGQITYQGKTSQEYGMHSKSGFLAEIAPNTEATVKVIYRPYIMPVSGPIEREVYISTNDPKNSKLILKVKTVVE